METSLNRTAVKPVSGANKQVYLMALEGLFILVIAAITLLGKQFVPPHWLLVALALATYKAARAVSFQEIFAPLRDSFTYVKPDSCGAGADVAPITDRGPAVYVIGSLLHCVSCTSVWSGLLLYGTWAIAGDYSLALIVPLAAAGASEALHQVTEFYSWGGRAFRVISGSISPDKG